MELSQSVSIANNKNSNIGFYPNPAGNIITPNLNDDFTTAKLTIFDIKGQEIEKMEIQNREPINIAHLSKGSYVFLLENQGKIFIEKIVKN